MPRPSVPARRFPKILIVLFPLSMLFAGVVRGGDRFTVVLRDGTKVEARRMDRMEDGRVKITPVRGTRRYYAYPFEITIDGEPDLELTDAEKRPDVFEGRMYVFHPERVSLEAARAACAEAGGALFRPDSEAEARFVADLVLGIDLWLPWTDAEREGDWVDAEGEGPAYAEWLPGKPDGADGNEDACVMRGPDGGWDDVDIDGRCAFVCEFPDVTPLTRTQKTTLASLFAMRGTINGSWKGRLLPGMEDSEIDVCASGNRFLIWSAVLGKRPHVDPFDGATEVEDDEASEDEDVRPEGVSGVDAAWLGNGRITLRGGTKGKILLIIRPADRRKKWQPALAPFEIVLTPGEDGKFLSGRVRIEGVKDAVPFSLQRSAVPATPRQWVTYWVKGAPKAAKDLDRAGRPDPTPDVRRAVKRLLGVYLDASDR